MTKKMREALQLLGDGYSVKTIDLEPCIYRNLGNGYDIEVSGLNNQKKGCIVYLWRTSPGLRIVYQQCIKNLSDLMPMMERMVNISKTYNI